MAELNSENLRTVLAAIFDISADYVIPKVGIWFNPQSMLPTATKPLTWVAYKITSNTPAALPYFNDQIDVVDNANVRRNYAITPKIATIQLQFVGTQAEELANQVPLWIKRTDVITQFLTVQGKIMADDMTVNATDFYQDGANNILAYNVNIRVAWKSMLLTTQQIVDEVEVDGDIT